VIEARSPYVLSEVLYVKMPNGVTPTPGMRLAIESLGPEFDGYGQVLIPTGEVTVVAPGAPGEATSVRLEQQFAEVHPDQLVVPLDMPKYPPVGQRAVAVTDGVKAKVLWVSSNPVQPTLGFFVVLDASEKDGVHVGDQFTLVRPRVRDDMTGLWLPEQDIATTQVVRVSPHSSTAVVIAQTMPAIAPGDAARLTAKMP
jgi:Flagellar assembly protein T, C-terminal domain